jgi:hypothetical protein
MVGQAVEPAGVAIATSGAADGPASAPEADPGDRRRWRQVWPPALVLLVALGLTAALAATSYRVSRNTEHRLLVLQVKQTGTVLQALLPGIETPLSSAAEIAATGGGSPAQFRAYMQSSVGAGQLFVTATLWRLDAGRVTLVSGVGQPSALVTSSAVRDRFLNAAEKADAVTLTGPLLGPGGRYRLAYAFAAAGSPRYVVTAEGLLPPGRRAKIRPGSPFADLRFALYLGPRADPAKLLEANVARLPVPGRTATVTVPFGASALTLVAATTSPLGGFLSGALWWIVALAGLVLAVAAAVATDWLARRRRAAERLAGQVSSLLAEQRGIAQTLQQALLPKVLETPAGITARARYIPGAHGVEIGGDWYDLLPLDARRVCFVVGDVSGRGVPAGTTMAKLRFATQAFVAEGHGPEDVLQLAGRMIDVVRDGHFATVLCGLLDLDAGTLTLASAGHLPPLLVSNGASRLLEAPVGPPLGADPAARYRSITVAVPADGVLVAFTDGLVERPWEPMDLSLERLRSSLDAMGTLEEVVGVLDARAAAVADDIAILGVQWSN